MLAHVFHRHDFPHNLGLSQSQRRKNTSISTVQKWIESTVRSPCLFLAKNTMYHSHVAKKQQGNQASNILVGQASDAIG